MLLALFLSVFLTPFSLEGQEINTEVRLALQRNYSNWRRAMISKDLRAWNSHTSRYRQTVTRNLIVSQKKDWPRSLFAVPIQPPEVELLRLIEARANGNVGRLVYYGHVDFRVSDEQPPNSIFMLYFIKESGEWKFDRTRYFNLAGNDRVEKMCKNGNFEFLNEPDFMMPEKPPETPALCPSPFYVGQIRIVSMGYETNAKFNNFHDTVVDDTAVNEVLIGGIRKGPNILKLTVKGSTRATSGERHLEVAVYVNSSEEDRPRVRVFHLDPGEKVQAEYEFTVWANAVTMQKR
ncbi:MAG: hypothetical protein KDN22_01060 [Verrucomicrobiae bacterium]|nr:hypothetical protein [Verrucomicrobiae bacterium]